MRRKHSAHTNASETKIKYFGEIKTIKFQKREAALAFAERQEARKLKVRVINFNGKEIYSSQWQDSPKRKLR